MLAEAYAQGLQLRQPSPAATVRPVATSNCPHCPEVPTQSTAQPDALVHRVIRNELTTYKEELLKDFADVVASVVR
jgi:hypothetical protein